MAAPVVYDAGAVTTGARSSCDGDARCPRGYSSVRWRWIRPRL